MTEVESVVYYDKDYPSSWISEQSGYPLKIINVFINNNIKNVNANELRDFMINSLEKGDSHKKLIIFSQDVFPETVVENYSTTTLREYLDAGGSVLWIGDIPLWYYGKDKNKTEKNRIEVWDKGTPAHMLGIVPVIANQPKRSVTITVDGKDINLKHRWSGNRPILKDEGITVLAKSESITCYYYFTKIQKKEGYFKRFWNWFGTIKSFGINTQFGGVEIERDKEIVKELEPHFHETNINAWVKCFNQDHPNCGFYRIWDYEPRHLTEKMIQELVKIANGISNRMSRPHVY